MSFVLYLICGILVAVLAEENESDEHVDNTMEESDDLHFLMNERYAHSLHYYRNKMERKQ